MSIVYGADLFCGGGGFTEGAEIAAARLGLHLDMVAIDHWQTAIASHAANHPAIRHICADVQTVRPESAVPGGRLHFLLASPPCTEFSRARGGKPVSDQMRAGAWWLLDWLSRVLVDVIVVENVPEFEQWGDVDGEGRRVRRKQGRIFVAWVAAMEALGYRCSWRILNAADYGDATTRRRFFLIARRDGKPIIWPEPTHFQHGTADLFGARRPWRPAREIIDWSRPGTSIFSRRRPLSLNTRRRIGRGLERFGGPFADRYIALLDLPDDETRRLIEAARARHAATPEPFLLGQHGGSVARSVDRPVPTIASDGAIAQIVPYYGTGVAHGVNEPVHAITAKARFGLAEPLIVPYGPRAEARTVDRPLHAVLSKDRLAVAEPVAQPARPFLVPQHGERVGQLARCKSIDEPAPAVTSHGAGRLVTPTIAPADGAIDPRRLIEAEGRTYLLDILFRMLTVDELKGAMGFRPNYVFRGTIADQTRQVGNAVAVNLAAALVGAVLDPDGAKEKRAS